MEDTVFVAKGELRGSFGAYVYVHGGPFYFKGVPPGLF